MNGKQAKFLKKVAKYSASSYRELKHAWTRMPWNTRHMVRENLQAAVDAAQAAEGKKNV